MTLLVVLYFIFTYRHQRPVVLDEEGSYVSGSRTDVTSDRRSRRGHRGGLGALAAAGAGAAGLAALRRRSRSRSRNADGSRAHGSRSRRSSRRRSDSFIDEKYSNDNHRRGGTWRDRLLGATAGIGALAALRSLFGGRGAQDGDSDSGRYTAPLDGASTITPTDLSRLEEGRPPASPEHHRHRRTEGGVGAHFGSTPRPRRSGDSVESFGSRDSFSPSRDNRRGAGLRDGVAALGVAGFLRHKFKQRRDRKEDRRVEEIRRREMETERLNRMDSRRYTGDGQPPRRGGRRPSLSESLPVTGSNPELARNGIPPIPPSAVTGAGRTDVDGRVTYAGPSTPRNPRRLTEGESSGSEDIASPSGGRRRRVRDQHNQAGPSTRRPEASQLESSNGESVTSPPVSVKVKMHGDGRHVTLRRLNEAEAAAEREARRDRSRRRRGGSVSSLSGVGDDRWRRVEAREAAQARQMQQQQSSAAAVAPPAPPAHRADPSELHLPPPPPIPAAAGAPASGLGSPGTVTGHYETGTDVSNYDSNRRRRRAERAQAKLARAGGSRVEFE